MVLTRRLGATVAIAAFGCVVAFLAGLRGVHSSSGYLLLATALLAIGLFGATHGIHVPAVSGNVRLVLIAVTFGVIVKAALIAGVMYAVFREPEYIVLGVAVAQIDPLSVAITRHSTRLSDRARAILSAWSSFDDPVTAILAVYLSTVALKLSRSAPAESDLLGGYSNVGFNLLFNALFVAAAAITWLAFRALRAFHAAARRDTAAEPASGWPVWLRVLAILALVGGTVLAVDAFLMLGIAIIGLFYRPGIDGALRFVVPAAFGVAVFMLGLVLADGVNMLSGTVLGLSAFGAQVVVGLAVTRSLPGDRLRLALSQQNGITAIILALLLETVFPGTVAIVAPAIVVVSLLHLVSNTIVDRIEDRKPPDRRSQDRRPRGVNAERTQ